MMKKSRNQLVHIGEFLMSISSVSSGNMKIIQLQDQFYSGLITTEEYWNRVIEIAGKELDAINMELQNQGDTYGAHSHSNDR